MRKAVTWFAKQMECKLRKNDAKKGCYGWLVCSDLWLFKRLIDEVIELEKELEKVDKHNKERDSLIIKEAVDVANFAMMIAFKAQKQLDKRTNPPAA